MHPPPSKHASKFGVIKLHFRKRTRTLTYEQKGGWQSRADASSKCFVEGIHAVLLMAIGPRCTKDRSDGIGCIAPYARGVHVCTGGSRASEHLNKLSEQ